MQTDEPNRNTFIKQVTKLFEDLSSTPAAKEQQPASPRITCTRLRRLREMKRELVLDGNGDGTSSTGESQIILDANSIRKNNESFADWVARTQQAHQQFTNMQNKFQTQTKANGKDNKDPSKTVNAFANFSPAALQVVARKPTTPCSTLKVLAAHYRAEVRESVARNENADHVIFSILARDGEDAVKSALLENSKLSRELLLKLCDDISPVVAEKAKNLLYQKTKGALADDATQPQQAEKQAAPPQSQHIEQTNGHGITLQQITANEISIQPMNIQPMNTQPTLQPQIGALQTNAPEPGIEELSAQQMLLKQGSLRIGQAKAGRLSNTQSEIVERDFLAVIAARSTTPPRRLAELAKHGNSIIRALVAANPNSTPEILWLLAKDPVLEVRMRLLGNYSCPPEIIESLQK